MGDDAEVKGTVGTGAPAADPLLDGWTRWHVLGITAAAVAVLHLAAFASMVSRSRDPNAGMAYVIWLLSVPGAVAGALVAAIVLRVAKPSRLAASAITAALMLVGIVVNLEILQWPLWLLWRS